MNGCDGIRVSPYDPSIDLANQNEKVEDSGGDENEEDLLDEGEGEYREENNDSNLMDEIVVAIQKLGDGLMKVERVKMDMARELQSMSMKMEIKHIEMIME
ncbi:hypothetical protein L2E82_08270 [Cichorium intybus]|uniref:Uncharacterized protein n=1 Tax=Cichorium intybus TaxID=13427 RepID=A0ACB9G6P8_CICIN|nr:hypothetical protein L2E82_08270 [Cichorium intybus]